jgi:predicted DNA-binding WGR domain protein
MATITESVTLNFTDLTGDKTGCTTLGSNKFWKGWVEDLGNGTANFECRWGPTGTPGSDKGSVRGTTLSAASDQLRKKVREKESKGYTKLDTRSDQEEMTKAAAKGVSIAAMPAVVTTKAASTFHPEVGRLLGVIYNETAKVVRAGLSAQAGATADNPIGNLSDRQLDLGGAILNEIEDELKRVLGPETPDNKTKTLPTLADGVPRREIIDLTNRFMSNIPREIGREMRGRENLGRLVLSSYDRLEAQRTFLQLLRDAHISKDIFQAAGAQTTTGGKESVWYAGLNSMIEHCEPGSAEFRRVAEIFNTAQSKNNANWWRNGKPSVRVARVFKFTRNGTDAGFDAYAAKVTSKPKAVGKIMAWHGTRTENLLGIGKSGLLMPENLPKGVVISGKAFGKGIYHAPAWNATGHTKIGSYQVDGYNGAFKSLNYTSARGAAYGANNTASGAFMFLQDVALGLADVHTSACWDVPKPTNWPTNDFIFASGAANRGGFVHDELVTFDQNAQIFRYLVEIECV